MTTLTKTTESQRAHEQARIFAAKWHKDDIDFYTQVIAIELLKFHMEENREQTEKIERELNRYL